MKSTIDKVSLNINLTPTEAIILQYVSEDGEDETRTLAYRLGMSRRRVMNVLEHLNRKGLIRIDSMYDELWVHLTNKGRRLIRYVWPESNRLAA